jgi:hypothetical protein
MIGGATTCGGMSARFVSPTSTPALLVYAGANPDMP